MERYESDEMTSSECWQMLTTQSVGRLALCVAALPAIMPVQYYVDGDEVAICLGHDELPRRSFNDAIVAFSSDFLDFATRSGWSVQVQGRITVPRQPASANRLRLTHRGPYRAPRTRDLEGLPAQPLPIRVCTRPHHAVESHAAVGPHQQI
jgi:nitroimidazol reductase NimA-like FMN-containing flavoprotein (pyridoxamine 5'-phosphate oxidase superfamily)